MSSSTIDEEDKIEDGEDGGEDGIGVGFFSCCDDF